MENPKAVLRTVSSVGPKIPFKAEIFEHEGHRLLFLYIWEKDNVYREWCTHDYMDYFGACRKLFKEAQEWYAENGVTAK